MKFLCPVCGYWQLTRPAKDDSICPCCGTHFGYHDYATTHEELRRKWVASGAYWFSRAQPAPLGWDPFEQLMEARLVPSRLDGGAPPEQNRTNARGSSATIFDWTTTAEAA